jgi:hypothetical protein
LSVLKGIDATTACVAAAFRDGPSSGTGAGCDGPLAVARAAAFVVLRFALVPLLFCVAAMWFSG